LRYLKIFTILILTEKKWFIYHNILKTAFTTTTKVEMKSQFQFVFGILAFEGFNFTQYLNQVYKDSHIAEKYFLLFLCFNETRFFFLV
jgi:hypothetical protein